MSSRRGSLLAPATPHRGTSGVRRERVLRSWLDVHPRRKRPTRSRFVRRLVSAKVDGNRPAGCVETMSHRCESVRSQPICAPREPLTATEQSSLAQQGGKQSDAVAPGEP